MTGRRAPERSWWAIGTMLAVLVGARLPAAAAAQHEPVIVAPKNGATLGNPVTVVIDLNGAEVPAQAGSAMPMGGMAAMPAAHADHADEHGHAHLIIDSPLPKPGTIVPMDEHHIRMMGHMMGVTKTTVTLPPGRHTLIMAARDHVVPPHAPRSQKITIQVK